MVDRIAYDDGTPTATSGPRVSHSTAAQAFIERLASNNIYLSASVPAPGTGWQTIEQRCREVAAPDRLDTWDRLDALCTWFSAAIEVVGHLHTEGRLHRNLTPANIWIAADGEDVECRVSDLLPLDGRGGTGSLSIYDHRAPETRDAGIESASTDVYGVARTLEWCIDSLLQGGKALEPFGAALAKRMNDLRQRAVGGARDRPGFDEFLTELERLRAGIDDARMAELDDLGRRLRRASHKRTEQQAKLRKRIEQLSDRCKELTSALHKLRLDVTPLALRGHRAELDRDSTNRSAELRERVESLVELLDEVKRTLDDMAPGSQDMAGVDRLLDRVDRKTSSGGRWGLDSHTLKREVGEAQAGCERDVEALKSACSALHEQKAKLNRVKTESDRAREALGEQECRRKAQYPAWIWSSIGTLAGVLSLGGGLIIALSGAPGFSDRRSGIPFVVIGAGLLVFIISAAMREQPSDTEGGSQPPEE